ncbi:lamin tail domain-containing protein, partial [Verrucomicrobiales bacterium]|nr:lamin tail domain-containing protein [Verrucomicrobiales bacterium]
MRPPPLGTSHALATCALLLSPLSEVVAAPIISEIHYHPRHAARTPEPTDDEFIEIHNPDTTTSDLSGWAFTNGIAYTFPSGTTLGPGAYLVVRAPSWTGRLSNSGERITLSDASGDTVDSVSYSDGADWADLRPGASSAGAVGWEWFAPHDGGGPSLERTSTSSALPSDAGQLWRSSTSNGGTPGAVNSTDSSNIPPLLLDVAHFPALPREGEPTIISVRILDDQGVGLPTNVTAELHYRDASSLSPPGYSLLRLLDDGFAGDLVSGDGIFTALVPGQPAGTVTEFFATVTDPAGNSRTWPGPTDDSGGQDANAHFLTVDPADLEPYSLDPTVGHYRLITTASELDTFDSSSRGSDALRSSTFISLRNGETQIRYRTFFRVRGNGSRGRNPPPIKLIFPPGQPHDGLANTNVNAFITWSQHIGMLLARASGIRSP